MNTCGACKHWRLEGPLSQHGYGTCDARPIAGHSTSAQCICRITRFEAKKQGEATTLPAHPERAVLGPLNPSEMPFPAVALVLESAS